MRVIRAARDTGIGSVAVYADQDRDARHVKLADEAYALDGTTSAETYLVIDKLLSVARRSGADAVHPGYGFLAENADFARAVIDAGLIWIGPSPDAIERLGDKVSARHVAEKVGAPLAPGTLNPVTDADEVLDVRRRGRPAGRHQGGVRRRRPRPQGRPHPRRGPRAVRVGHPRGDRRLRPRRVLRREVPRRAAPRRDPVPRRLRTATSSSSRPATARCSAATRSSSRRRPRRSSPTSRSSCSTRRRRRSSRRSATSAPAPASS